MFRESMSCRTWLDMVADYLEGGLPQDRLRAFEGHAHACQRCANLLATIRDGEVPVDAMPDLTEAVLARTSGPACGLVERTLAARDAAHGEM